MSLNKENLRKYVDWFKKNIHGNPERELDMGNYSEGDVFPLGSYEEYSFRDNYEKGETEKAICGTCACALGWAPLLFPVKERHFGDSGMFNYDMFCKEYFGIEEADEEWDYLFNVN